MASSFLIIDTENRFCIALSYGDESLHSQTLFNLSTGEVQSNKNNNCNCNWYDITKFYQESNLIVTTEDTPTRRIVAKNSSSSL